MLKSILAATIFIGLLSFDLPTGWFKAGSKPKSYDMGIEKGLGPDGKNVATIKSIEKKIDGFGTLMQKSNPEKYLGKRIKMTGFVKSENVEKWAGLWLRVDQSGSSKPLSFDNMGNRPIKGTTAWTKYEIVLDVPSNSSFLVYGALLDGPGQIWFDNISFEIVDNTAPTTGSKLIQEPVNLDFEK